MQKIIGPGALAGAVEAGDRYKAWTGPDTAILRAAQYLRRQRAVEAIHRLGARVVAELLNELDRHHRLGADLDRRLARYAALDPTILHALAADRFAAAPIRVVEGVHSARSDALDKTAR